jgi:hypothetical protein
VARLVNEIEHGFRKSSYFIWYCSELNEKYLKTLADSHVILELARYAWEGADSYDRLK